MKIFLFRVFDVFDSSYLEKKNNTHLTKTSQKARGDKKWWTWLLPDPVYKVEQRLNCSNLLHALQILYNCIFALLIAYLEVIL